MCVCLTLSMFLPHCNGVCVYVCVFKYIILFHYIAMECVSENQQNREVRQRERLNVTIGNFHITSKQCYNSHICKYTLYVRALIWKHMTYSTF